MNTRRKYVAVVLGLIIIGLGFFGYGLVEPQTSAGYASFRFGYAFPPTRSIFLWFYGSILDEFNGSYVPGRVDMFLASRLHHRRGTFEWNAILNFQLARTSYRWGGAIFHTDNDLKRDIIRDLMQRVDLASPIRESRILLFVEGLRRSDPLIKGQFATESGQREAMFPTIKSRFKAWWGDGSSWPANKHIDPLNGTGIFVHSP